MQQRDLHPLAPAEQQRGDLEGRVVDGLVADERDEEAGVLERNLALVGAPKDVIPARILRRHVGSSRARDDSARRSSAAVAEPLREAHRQPGVTHEALRAIDVVGDPPKLERVVPG